MQLDLFDHARPGPPSAPPAFTPTGRAARGARGHHSGRAAEEIAERVYAARGARVLARRLRTPEGEIDLVLREGGVVVFVEVKRRRRATGPDSPVSAGQWRRLGRAALWYIMTASETTGADPFCRFDAVIVGGDGSAEVIENARTFDES